LSALAAVIGVATAVFAGGAIVMWAALVASDRGIEGVADDLQMHPAAATLLVAALWPGFVWKVLTGGFRASGDDARRLRAENQELRARVRE
jgi:hypothetical protein